MQNAVSLAYPYEHLQYIHTQRAQTEIPESKKRFINRQAFADDIYIVEYAERKVVRL